MDEVVDYVLPLSMRGKYSAIRDAESILPAPLRHHQARTVLIGREPHDVVASNCIVSDMLSTENFEVSDAHSTRPIRLCSGHLL